MHSKFLRDGLEKFYRIMCGLPLCISRYAFVYTRSLNWWRQNTSFKLSSTWCGWQRKVKYWKEKELVKSIFIDLVNILPSILPSTDPSLEFQIVQLASDSSHCYTAQRLWNWYFSLDITSWFCRTHLPTCLFIFVSHNRP